MPCVDQPATDRLATPAQPDDGIVQGTAGGGIKNHIRFALVGDAQAHNVLGQVRSLAEKIGNDGHDIVVNLVGVMLHPSWLGVQLAMRQRHVVEQFSGGGEEQCLGCRSALIDPQEGRHTVIRWLVASSVCAVCARPAGLIP